MLSAIRCLYSASNKRIFISVFFSLAGSCRISNNYRSIFAFAIAKTDCTIKTVSEWQKILLYFWVGLTRLTMVVMVVDPRN